MKYVLQTTRLPGFSFNGRGRTCTSFMLHEMTAREFKQAQAEAPDYVRYERVHFTAAHAYVKRGGVHSTGLWTDADGRIRYAPSDPGV